MKRTSTLLLGLVALVLSGVLHSNALNLWELRDGNNVPQVTIDSSKRLKDAKLDSISILPGKFFKGSFVFQSSVTINGLQIWGATDTAKLREVPCTARLCVAGNTSDQGLYTSTAAPAGNWRNITTGLGLPPPDDPTQTACNLLDTCLDFEAAGIALTDALNLCQGGSPGCGGDTALCTDNANICCVSSICL